MIKLPISASRDYNVIMERGSLSEAGSYILEALGSGDKKICIVTDATVAPLYGQPSQPLWQSLADAGFHVSQFVFPGGETAKNMETIAALLDFLASHQFTRSDVLLALGGGITGDVTGFAAATFLRGIRYIQVPTTLLATVDSSVGGKTGVNLKAGKNLAGAFWQPSLVLFDPDVLQTLSDERKLDGIAEAIKAGCIADETLLELAETRFAGNAGQQWDQTDAPTAQNALSGDSLTDVHQPASAALLADDDFLTELAARAVEIKRQIVEEDERESGSRQLLNFGHTIAHAIEKCSNYEISHGHAVAMGMVIVSNAAQKLGWSRDACYSRILRILQNFRFPLDCPFDAEQLTGAALQDKKRRGNSLTLVIPEAMGRCGLKTIPVEELKDFVACGLT